MPRMPSNLWVNNIKKDIAKTEKVHNSNDVQNAFYNSKFAHLQLILLDSKYWTVPIDTWEKMIARTKIDHKQYVAERYDCDDFAFSLKGRIGQLFSVNGCGLVVDFSGSHAYNLIITDTLELAALEPQADRLYVGGTSPAYAMQSGFVLL